MNYTKEKIVDIFAESDKYLKEFSLPTWDDFPSIDLYMDQVVALLNEYLSIFIAPKGDMQITSTMINNYVKLKTIPAPEKKKYQKKHLAYLVMVCILKQTHSMSTITSIIPPDMDEKTLKGTYESFVKNHNTAYAFVSEKIYDVASKFFAEKNVNSDSRMRDLVLQVAVSANIFKLITEWVSTKSK